MMQWMKNKKRWLAVFLCAAVFSAGILPQSTLVYASDTAELDTYNLPSEEEIREAFEDYRFKEAINAELSYDEKPRTGSARSLEAGRLSDETIQDGLDMLNLIRFVVGLDEVDEDPSYSDAAQHASVLLAYMDKGLTHEPSQPSGVSDEFYELAYEGASHSNLSGGSNLAETMLSYMSDAGSPNYAHVGHRRWLIYPNLESVGFGMADGYSATYVIGETKEIEQLDVAWPAPETPLELFGNGDPWSINLGEDYDTPEESEVKVTLRERKSGKTWRLDNHDDNRFFVNNGGYGQGRCIIFRPKDISCDPGDIFDVKIEGLSGKADTLEYSVHFFRVVPQYTADFDLNGGFGFISKPDDLNRIELPGVDQVAFLGSSNMELSGWLDEETGKVYAPGEKLILERDTVFSAIYKEVGSHESGSSDQSENSDDKEEEKSDDSTKLPSENSQIPHTKAVHMVEHISWYEITIPYSDAAGASVVSSNPNVAEISLQSSDSSGDVYRITARDPGDALVTVSGIRSPYALEIKVFPKGGSITLDTVNYRMAPGNIYDIGVTITDGNGTPVSSAQVQEMYRTGKLRVTDSRTGSIVDLRQLPNGSFRVTGKNPGTCYIVYEVLENGEVWTHASVRIDVTPGAVQGGVATRDTSWWPEIS